MIALLKFEEQKLCVWERERVWEFFGSWSVLKTNHPTFFSAFTLKMSLNHKLNTNSLVKTIEVSVAEF